MATTVTSESNIRDITRGFMQQIKDLFGVEGAPVGYKAIVPANVPHEVSESVLRRNEIIAKLLSACFGLAVSFSISYFGIKWLASALDPTKEEKKKAQLQAQKLLRSIGVNNVKLTEYELCIASNLVDPLNMETSWHDIGGLDSIIQEIKESVILPFKRKDLFADSDLLQPPKGVLLYGPPGCGKTMIAKATAKAAGARFINLQLSSLVDKWYGESQKRAEAVFSLAVKLQPTIIFIDEIDSFLRSRTSNDHEATAMIKTQFMSFWDGLLTDNSCQVIIMGATNRQHDVDAAILRRMPCMFQIGYPNKAQREKIIEVILKNEPIADDVNIQMLAEETKDFSGSDIKELCRNAAIYRVKEYLRSEDFVDSDEYHDAREDRFRIMHAGDFEQALNKMKEAKIMSSMPTVFQQADID